MASAAVAPPPVFKGTADLCDEYLNNAQYVDYLGFLDFGGVKRFQGSCVTVQCIEDNTKVKECLSEDGAGKVLVVHAGGCLTRAFVGDMMATTAIKNNWAGVIVNGCIRDSVELATMQIGIKALGSHPRKTVRRGDGIRDVPITFGGCTFKPDDWIVSDEDGIIVLDSKPVA